MNKTITINRDDFTKKSARLISENEHLKKLIETQPSLILVFAMYSVELEKALFEEGVENE